VEPNYRFAKSGFLALRSVPVFSLCALTQLDEDPFLPSIAQMQETPRSPDLPPLRLEALHCASVMATFSDANDCDWYRPDCTLQNKISFLPSPSEKDLLPIGTRSAAWNPFSGFNQWRTSGCADEGTGLDIVL